MFRNTNIRNPFLFSKSQDEFNVRIFVSTFNIHKYIFFEKVFQRWINLGFFSNKNNQN